MAQAEQNALCWICGLCWIYVLGWTRYIFCWTCGLGWTKYTVLNMWLMLNTCLGLNKIHYAEYVAWAEKDALCWIYVGWTMCIGLNMWLVLNKMHWAINAAWAEQDALCWARCLGWTRYIMLNMWLVRNKMHCKCAEYVTWADKICKLFLTLCTLFYFTHNLC